MPFCRDWKKTVLQPSFKFIEFEVDSDALTGGRRIEQHEYINRDFWDNEDLGRAAETKSVRGYVFGDDADVQAQKLAAALNSFGPGELVLPARPMVMARCTRWNSTFTSNEMGKIIFDMDFAVESVAQGGFVNSVMQAIAVHNAMLKAAQELGDLFSIAFDTLKRRSSSISKVATPARNAAAITIRKTADYLDVARRRVSRADVTGVARLEFAARDIRARALNLAYAGEKGARVESDIYVADEATVKAGFAGVWIHALDLLLRLGDPTDIADAFYFLATFQAQTIDGGDHLSAVTVRQEIALTGTVAQFVQRSALVYWATAVTRRPFISSDDAIDIHNKAVSSFNAIIESVDNLNEQDAISLVRDRLILFLASKGSALPQTIVIENDAPMPAAVIATILYNDSTRVEEIVDRNMASHPLFMPTKLEALAPASLARR
jgi:prophage DNA circulation protein